MKSKCNLICIGGPGFPYAVPEDIQALSPNIGDVTIFENSKNAFDAMHNNEIGPISAIIFTDDEVKDLSSRRLYSLMEKYSHSASRRGEQFYPVTTGEIKNFVSSEKIYTVSEFIENIKELNKSTANA